jgi:hypothetical protein
VMYRLWLAVISRVFEIYTDRSTLLRDREAYSRHHERCIGDDRTEDILS